MRTISRVSLALGLVAWGSMISCSDRAIFSSDTGMDRGALDQHREPLDGFFGEGLPQDSHVADIVADGLQRDGGGAVTCDPFAVTCKSLPTPCNIGEIRAVVGTCWGDCVPIALCSDVPVKPNCDLTTVLCERMPPFCPQGYVPTNNDNGCYGPCVPITTCSCTSGGPPSQCPEDFVCHNFAQRCGPLV